jgi:hypothetical protein
MAVAQQLYEGLDIGEGSDTGLITYMRTDSTNVSASAQASAREFVLERYGDRYLPEEPPTYKTKSRGAQEAHEAIRPTVSARDPKTVKEHLTRDQFRLYTLIWQRFMASQMSPAVYDTLSIQITGTTEQHTYQLRASGSTLKFPGFLVIYEDVKDEESDEDDGSDARIPEGLEEDQPQKLVRLVPEQHFTQPPPRFTEASLVKALEENGIGRPSTYAPTLSTLQNRNYVDRALTELRAVRRQRALELAGLDAAIAAPQAAPWIEADTRPVLAREMIAFPPGESTLPAAVQPMLATMIAAARQSDARIYLIGEASEEQLAVDRVLAVGLALTRLGATAELIEYEIAEKPVAERVSLLLKPPAVP